MGRKIKIFIIGTLSVMIITPTVWYGLQFYWQNKTKTLYSQAKNSYQKKYAYTLIKGSLDQTMYARSYDEGVQLVDYYNQVSDYYAKIQSGEIEREKYISPISGDTLYKNPIIIPIPIKYLGVPQEVYLPKGAENDSVIKVYVFDTKCWGYFEAYVPTFNLHDTLHPDSLLQDLKRHIESLPKQSDDIYGRPSPYGFYCN